MPNPTLSDALEEAYASAPSGVVIYHTLEFRHAAFSQPIRVVHGHQDITATLEATAPLNPGQAVTFSAFSFEFQLPEIADGGSPELEIIIDAVSREIVSQVEAAMAYATKISVTYRPYLSTDLTAPHMDPVWHMTVREIEADVFRIKARASFGELINRQFPGENYTAVRFPGLVA